MKKFEENEANPEESRLILLGSLVWETLQRRSYVGRDFLPVIF
ncbi:hypothetical protein AALP_AA6G284200 [Arabis alpina]|uniref:Uncharacterized protein n=1 Tax=Arabis alpina TaxID=50452 RepID=A0A087GSA0_ARAAL|nr:hypothetical protein AALP_AA6G284200 [Arabis alpina]